MAWPSWIKGRITQLVRTCIRYRRQAAWGLDKNSGGQAFGYGTSPDRARDDGKKLLHKANQELKISALRRFGMRLKQTVIVLGVQKTAEKGENVIDCNALQRWIDMNRPARFSVLRQCHRLRACAKIAIAVVERWSKVIERRRHG
jgi:hypothetical protein